MKKIYMTPNVNAESAQPTSFLCVSFQSDADIEDNGGSDGEARTKEDDWDMWGAE